MITKDKIKIDKEYTYNGLLITAHIGFQLSYLINSQSDMHNENEVEEMLKEQILNDILGSENE
jgi:hypothetical protein